MRASQIKISKNLSQSEAIQRLIQVPQDQTLLAELRRLSQMYPCERRRVQAMPTGTIPSWLLYECAD